jgi:hypothetical protein
MTKKEIKSIKNILENAIVESEKMWLGKESHATIIGYLQGTIKVVARSLDVESQSIKVVE